MEFIDSVNDSRFSTQGSLQPHQVPSLRAALNAYQIATTLDDKRAANELVIAVLKHRQWDWERAL
jgi:hypothetical protein